MTVREVPVVFVLTTYPDETNPNPGYTHRCDATLFGRVMWSSWGKSAEEAERNTAFQVEARVERVFRAL